MWVKLVHYVHRMNSQTEIQYAHKQTHNLISECSFLRRNTLTNYLSQFSELILRKMEMLEHRKRPAIWLSTDWWLTCILVKKFLSPLIWTHKRNSFDWLTSISRVCCQTYERAHNSIADPNVPENTDGHTDEHNLQWNNDSYWQHLNSCLWLLLDGYTLPLPSMCVMVGTFGLIPFNSTANEY